MTSKHKLSHLIYFEIHIVCNYTKLLEIIIFYVPYCYNFVHVSVNMSTTDKFEVVTWNGTRDFSL